MKALMKDMQMYLKEKKIPVENAPDLIIVNNAYFVAKKQSGHFSRGIGDYSEIGSYVTATGSKNIGGLGLLAFVSAVQRISNLGSLVMLNFFNYEQRINLAVANNDLKKELIRKSEFFGDDTNVS
jgi:hypothetical protein